MSNDPTLFVKDAAAKWKAKGIKTYALGYGDKINEEGLSQTSTLLLLISFFIIIHLDLLPFFFLISFHFIPYLVPLLLFLLI